MLDSVKVVRDRQVSIERETGCLGEGYLGDRLQSFFDGVTGGPLPDWLTKLADELDGALDRGEICKGSNRL